MLEDIAEVHNMRGKKWNKYKEFLKWYCRNQGSGKCLNVLLKI